jgi:hypothetical protein
MAIELGKDGRDGKLYILQARWDRWLEVEMISRHREARLGRKKGGRRARQRRAGRGPQAGPAPSRTGRKSPARDRR